MITLNKESIVVGVDVHKYSHTAVALNAWGQEKGKLDFSNDSLPEYAAWLRSLGEKPDIVVALEDVNCYGVHLVEELRGDGWNIRYVPAILTERERKQSTKRQKSDYTDAKRVGKVMLTKYEETLPAKESMANEEELQTARQLDLLLMERRDLVREKTVLKNQLHGLLHQYYGDHYTDQFKKTFHRDSIAFYEKDLAQEAGNKRILAVSIARRLKRLTLLEGQIVAISKEVAEIGDLSPAVKALSENIHGCGMVTAATVMAELTTIKRFHTQDKLASYAGVAPTERSSGRKVKLHTNPFGNRRFNKALHVIALSQIACKGDERGGVYYQKKLKEGKTKLWALRCLKRQIVKKVFQVLKQVG
ncbi:MAG: IS110 family transposase [Candidatus Yonathbacteria bacterium]|nr:IS110 family transposase [Candidatus Yonathbacteria bacterium]